MRRITVDESSYRPDPRVTIVLNHMFKPSVPTRELDSSVLHALAGRAKPAGQRRTLPLFGWRQLGVILIAGLVSILALTLAPTILKTRPPSQVSAKTILLRAARAMAPKAHQATERVYNERSQCPPYGRCRYFTAAIWSTSIKGSYLEHGIEMLSAGSRVVQYFRLIHGGPYRSWVDAWWSRKLSSGIGGQGGAGEFWGYFIHGVDDPGIASGLVGQARRDGFIDLGSGTGYRLVGKRSFDHATNYALRFSSPGYAYYAYFDAHSYVLRGMQGPGFKVALRHDASVPLCAVFEKEFRFFREKRPNLRVCPSGPARR